MVWMVLPLARMGRNIIQVSFDDMLYIMEGKIHFPLEGSSDIFQTKGNFLIHEGSTRKNEGFLMLVF